MGWIPYALATGVALAVADVCVKLAAGKLSNSLALLLYGSCTFLAGAGWVLWERSRSVPQFAEWPGVLAAVGVGIAFSCVTVGLYATFGAGAPISLSVPLTRVVGVALASLAGLALLHEPFTLRYAVGMLLAGGGIYLVVTR